MLNNHKNMGGVQVTEVKFVNGCSFECYYNLMIESYLLPIDINRRRE